MHSKGYTLRGHSMAAFQAFVAALALAVLFVLPFTHAAPDTAGVWVADQKQLKRVDPAVNQYVQAITLSNAAEAIAFDAKSNVLWALANKHLLKFNSSGVLAADLDLSPSSQSTEALKRLVLDPYDASLWVAGEKTVLHVSAQGQILLKWTSSQNIQAIGLDPDQSLWVLSQNALYQLSPAGTVLNNLVLPASLIPDPTFLAVDGLGGYLWVAGKKSLIRFDANDLTKPPLTAAVPATVNGTNNKLEALLTHPIFGTVWAVSTDTLLLFDRDAGLVRQTNLAPQGLGIPQAIAYEPGSASLWLGGKTALGRFTPNGDFVTKLPADIAISSIATGPFSVSPTLTLLEPINNSVTNNPRPPFRLGLGAECNGQACDLVDAYTQAFTLDATLNGLSIGSLFNLANREALYIPPARLPEGANLFSAQAEDIFGHLSNRVDGQVTIDTIPPQFLSLNPADGSTLTTGTITVSGQVDDPTASVMLRNAAGTVLNVGNATFSFSITLTAGANSYSLTAQDPAGNVTTVPLRLTYSAGPGLNPSPINPTVATLLSEATKFLYSGANPVQTGVNPAALDPKRIAVVRGKVSTRDGAPLSGVDIRVLNHPEFGQTQSRADGIFDLAVNGGGWLTIVYEKGGYLPAQRQVNAPWQDYVWATEASLIPLDSQVTTINLNAPIPMQVARGSVVTDSDGTRQATVFFPQGTTATIIKPDGTTQPLITLSVRATEYTVGPNGPKAMPAPLPPTSGYTYAVELSVDEAIAQGVKVNGKDVIFNQPVFFYVDNFLSFPAGGVVPVGYYDNTKGVWIPYPNGRVIKIISVSGGLAQIDANGDGNPDDAAQLTALGITDAERAQLANLYPAGKSLWRAALSHFSTWDCNWTLGPPGDAEAPEDGPEEDDDTEPDPCKNSGSIIECQNQTFGESVGVTGTPFSLNYRSSRVPGRKAGYSLTIPLSGATIPASLKRIELEIGIAGRWFTQTFTASPGQRTVFIWDGQDAYGRTPQGAQPVSVRIIYVYDALYQQPAPDFPRSFGLPTGIIYSAVPSRQEWTMVRETRNELGSEAVGVWDARGQGLGAWTLNAHHVYDSQRQLLYLGNGNRRDARNVGNVVNTVAGTPGARNFYGDGGPAKAAAFQSPTGVALDAAGNLFIADTYNYRIRKVTPDGIVSTVAGNGVYGFSGDGGPATAAAFRYPYGVAVDAQGNLFIADTYNFRVRKVSPNGIITTVAGGGSAPGDGGPATQALLSHIYGIAVDAYGNLFISEWNTHRIRKVGPDGIITTVAGNRGSEHSGDGGPATAASFGYPYGVTVDAQGNLFIAACGDDRVRKVGPNGIITTVAGKGFASYSGDGGPATAAGLACPTGVAVDGRGNLFIADHHNHRIRRVSPDGFITTAAGTGEYGFSGERGPAAAAKFTYHNGIAVDPQGNLYMNDWHNHIIRKVYPFLSQPTISASVIASQDGSELYEFDSAGRHLRTLSALTGALVHQFTYNGNGYLTHVTDGDGNITTIERSGDVPTAIIAPNGQRTSLSLDANGYLAAVTNPAGEATGMANTADGLLTQFTNPRGKSSVMTYDDKGRLTRDENPAGGFWALSRTKMDKAYEVSLTSAQGRQTRYHVKRLTTDDRSYTNTLPDGHSLTGLRKTDGNTITAKPDGTLATMIKGPDPRFGMQSPIVKSRTTTLPSGLAATMTQSRTATLADPNNPLSLIAQIHTYNINGRTTTRSFTAANRTATTITPGGRQYSRVMDTQGRTTQARLTGLHPVDVQYDARGRLIGIAQGAAADLRTATASYNAQGYVNSITDPLGRNHGFAYDLAGRLTQQTLPDGRVITWSYDANGNVVGLTPPSRPTHTFSYTPVDLEERYTPPSAGLPLAHTQYAYNLDKQLTTITRPDGQTVNLSYNPAGKLTTVTLPTGTITADYSATTGKRSSLSTSQGVGLSYVHDGFLPVSETYSGPIAGTVTRSYNNDFRTTGISVNGNAIAFGYDADNLLKQAGAMSLARNTQNGLLTGTTLGSVTTAHTSNAFGELNDFQASYAGGGLYSFALTRDKRGNITQRTETLGATTDTYGYAYDTTGRLVEVTKNGAVQSSYSYDPNGSRLPGTYDNQDRLLTYGTNAYTYTANGELKTKTNSGQTTAYTYDILGNLTKATLPNGTVIDYVIDGRNRRIGKKVNDSLTQGFLYQNKLKPVAELDGSGTVVSRFVYGSKFNVPDYLIKGGATYRIISDHLGSPRLIVNTANGTVEQRLNYDEFGNITQDTNPGFQPFGFAGGLYDQHTKLVRFGARDYDAESGRWTAKDPIRFRGGDANLYAYVGGNPINWIDPSGRAIAIAPLIPVIVEGLEYAATALIGIGLGIAIDDWLNNRPIQNESNEDDAETPDDGPMCPVPPDDPTKPPGEDWEWKGNGPPGSREGNWVNQETGQKLHPDLDHPPGKDPHYGLTNPDGSKWDYFPGSGQWVRTR